MSRELGVPAIVGTEHGTELVATGQMVTVSCAEGQTGFVYDGVLRFDVERLVLKEVPRPRVRIMMNVGNPADALRLSLIPNDGVGLAREEFIVTSHIGIHPMALVEYLQLKDSTRKAEIDRITAGYVDKSEFFVDRLAQGIAMIGAAFHPKDVIVRFSDFKTSEYANLLGGRAYEPVEENPMLGFRGAARYYDPRYSAAFALECQAINRTVGVRLLTGVAILIGLAACTGRSADPSASSSPPPSIDPPSEIAAVQLPIAEVASAIKAGLDNGHDPAFGSLPLAERKELTALYQTEGYVPLWVDAVGRPSGSAGEALTLLGGAAADGLNSVDYSFTQLRGLAAVLEATQPPLAQDVTSFELGLSASMLRYFRHVHMGRVDPRAIGFRMTAPADSHDFAALLRSAVTDGRIIETAADLTPPLALYRGLRGMLAHYRLLAADATLEPLPPPAATLRPGEPYAGLRALHQRLVAFGDLPPDTPPPADSAAYQGALVAGVKRFQIRHGLESDGILGKGTQTALHVPLAWRIRQIELAIERLRWLPHLSDDRLVAVNIPMFHLWVWDSIPPGGAPLFGMDVIVGRALNTRTPVFVEEMRYLIFRPYWNVPPGILRQEVLPAIERDADYLRQRDMEIVWGPGDDAQPVAATAENVALLRRGLLRVRQRPGPNNAMGLVKFIFPNDENVYMHDTPAQELFSRTRRDFSRGCVRLGNPVALAEWALKDQPEWTRDRILAAMNGSRPRRVNLPRPIQVILFYITAVVMPEDGTVRFAEDIYGHDSQLDRALARRRATP